MCLLRFSKLPCQAASAASGVTILGGPSPWECILCLFQAWELRLFSRCCKGYLINSYFVVLIMLCGNGFSYDDCTRYLINTSIYCSLSEIKIILFEKCDREMALHLYSPTQNILNLIQQTFITHHAVNLWRKTEYRNKGIIFLFLITFQIVVVFLILEQNTTL